MADDDGWTELDPPANSVENEARLDQASSPAGGGPASNGKGGDKVCAIISSTPFPKDLTDLSDWPMEDLERAEAQARRQLRLETALFIRLERLEQELSRRRAAPDVLLFRPASGGKHPPPFVGLQNRGNDCFWLAAIQALRHTAGLPDVLREAAPAWQPGGPGAGGQNLVQALADLLRAMDDAATEAIGATAADVDALSRQKHAAYVTGRFDELPRLQAAIEAAAAAAGTRSVLPDTAAARIGFVAQCEHELRQKLLVLDNRRQQQQDAGEYLECLLDQLAEVCGEDGRPLLERTSTNYANYTVGAAEKDRLNNVFTEMYRRASDTYAADLESQVASFSANEWMNSAASARRSFIGKLFCFQNVHLSVCVECRHAAAAGAEPSTVETVHPPRYSDGPVELPQLLGLGQTSQRWSPGAWDFKCPGCGKVATTCTRAGLVRLPECLVVRINRIHTSFAETAGQGAQLVENRISTIVTIPEYLDASSGLFSAATGPLDYSGARCGTLYRLYGAIFHRGASTRSGHYTAWVRNSAGQLPAALASNEPTAAKTEDEDPTAWTVLDDGRAYPAGMAAHPAHAEEGTGDGAQRATMLFYRRLDTSDDLRASELSTVAAASSGAASLQGKRLLCDSEFYPAGPVKIPIDFGRGQELTVWFRNSSPFNMELKAVRMSDKPTLGPKVATLPPVPVGADASATESGEGIHNVSAFSGDTFVMVAQGLERYFELGPQPFLQAVPLTVQWVDVSFDMDTRQVNYERLVERPRWAPR